MENFLLPIDKTAKCVASLPVPAVVGIQMKGDKQFVIGISPQATNFSSPVCACIALIAFATSMVLPPPTAIIISALESLKRCAPCKASSNLGFAVYSVNIVISYSFNNGMIKTLAPQRSKELFPVTTKILLTSNSDNTQASLVISPRPINSF